MLYVKAHKHLSLPFVSYSLYKESFKQTFYRINRTSYFHFFQKPAVFEIIKKTRQKETNHRIKFKPPHALCMLKDKDHKYTIRIFNTNYFLPITTMGRINSTLHLKSHCLLIYSPDRDLN